MTKFFFNYASIFLIVISVFLKISIDRASARSSTTKPPSTTSESIQINITIDKKEKVFKLSKVESNNLFNPKQKIYEIKSSLAVEAGANELNSLVSGCILYRDESSHSAVLLWSSKSLLNGIVGGKYILKYKNYTESNGTYNVALTSSDIEYTRSKRNTKRTSERLIDQFSRTSKLRRVAKSADRPSKNLTFYLESLVIINIISIDGLIPKKIQTSTNNVHQLYMIHLLSVFNAIDMYLTGTEFNMNIAGVIFQDMKTATLDFGFEVSSVSDHLKKLNQKANTKFSKDSYDLVFYLTDYYVYDSEIQKPVSGFLSYPVRGIYATRNSNSTEYHPLIMANSRLDYRSIADATHRIFHLIGGLTYVKRFNKTTTDSSIIIRSFDNNCHHCFGWNEDFCIFVNQPRVKSIGAAELVSKNDQCWCHNYYYRYKNATNDDVCTNGFQCREGTKVVLNVTSVLEGTPCDKNKVCWQGTCTNIASI